MFKLRPSELSFAAVAARLPKYGFSNPHWIPQSHFCGGTVLSSWGSYTHHILLGNLGTQVTDLFRGRVPDATLASINLLMAKSQDSNDKHVTHAENTELSHTVRQQIVDFYWEDYRLLLTKGLPMNAHR